MTTPLYLRILNKSPLVPRWDEPADFLLACVGYFEWADEHPLLEESVGWYQGNPTRTDLRKMRAYTKQGLATYLGIPVGRLDHYKQRGGGWTEAVEILEQIMHEQKFTAAAAGLLNAGLIGRDLGLADRQELTGRDGGPLQTEAVVSDDLRAALDAIADKITGGDSEGEVAGDSPTEADRTEG